MNSNQIIPEDHDTNADGFWPRVYVQPRGRIEIDFAPLPNGEALTFHAWRSRGRLVGAWLDDRGRMLGLVEAGTA